MRPILRLVCSCSCSGELISTFSEAIAITLADLTLESDQLTVRVRLGKGAKDRMVPVHPELREVIYNIVYYRASDGPIIGVSRQAAYQWMQQALAAAVRAGGIPKRQTNRDSRPTPQFRASHDRKRNPAQPTVGLVGPRITSYDGDLPAVGPGYRWAYGWIRKTSKGLSNPGLLATPDPKVERLSESSWRSHHCAPILGGR